MNGDPIPVGGKIVENIDRRANNQASEANDPILLSSFKNEAQNQFTNPNQIMLRSGKELLPPNG